MESQEFCDPHEKVNVCPTATAVDGDEDKIYVKCIIVIYVKFIVYLIRLKLSKHTAQP